MSKCKKCGNEISENEKFCPNCGTENEEYGKQQENVEKKPDIHISRKKLIIIGIIIAAVVISLIIAIAVSVSSSNSDDDDSDEESKTISFRRVYNSIGDSYYVTIASDNSYIEVDTNPLDLEDFSSTTAWELIEEINEKLGLPESLYKKMGQTRALDGRISQTYDDITVSWTYHPDHGLEVLYEKEK